MAQLFSRSIQIRWADIDANRHLRHSAYYDFGAAVRMMFFIENGLTSQKLEELQIGPILFREEALFKREIRLEDSLTIDLSLTKATPDYARWSLHHNFYKENNILAATVTLDGAWMDTHKRKLAVPNVFVQNIFENLVRTAPKET